MKLTLTNTRDNYYLTASLTLLTCLLIWNNLMLIATHP